MTIETNPFARLAAFPEADHLELHVLAHAILAAHSSDDVHAGLRTAKRVMGGLDAGRWLNGSAFSAYVEDGHVYWDELQPLAAAYLGETP